MSFETPGIGRILLSVAVGYVDGKYQQMEFMDNAVNNAAERVAGQHTGLAPEVLPNAFNRDAVKELINEFDAGGDPITVERVSDTLNEEMLDLPAGISKEQFISEFFENLEQEISRDGKIGRKLQTHYHQHHSAQIEEIHDALEELLGSVETGIDELVDRNPSALTERGFLEGMSIFSESKPSYNSYVGLYAFAHDPYDAQNRTAIRKQINIAEDIIDKELKESDKKNFACWILGVERVN